MKRLFIYKKGNVPDITGRYPLILLRATTVHPTFVGIGKFGQINALEFKKLSEDLEPTSTSFDVVDA